MKYSQLSGHTQVWIWASGNSLLTPVLNRQIMPQTYSVHIAGLLIDKKKKERSRHFTESYNISYPALTLPSLKKIIFEKSILKDCLGLILTYWLILTLKIRRKNTLCISQKLQVMYKEKESECFESSQQQHLYHPQPCKRIGKENVSQF